MACNLSGKRVFLEIADMELTPGVSVRYAAPNETACRLLMRNFMYSAGSTISTCIDLSASRCCCQICLVKYLQTFMKNQSNVAGFYVIRTKGCHARNKASEREFQKNRFHCEDFRNHGKALYNKQDVFFGRIQCRHL
jgi:hypothetical protein